MKKLLLIALMLLVATPVFAQRRGALTNVFASHYTVTTGTTITLPHNSRDIYIRNGSSIQLYVSLRGDTIPQSQAQAQTDFVSNSPTAPNIVSIDADSDLTLTDFVTDSLYMTTAGDSASTVTVIVTY